MKTATSDRITAGPGALARIGSAHGYRFEGDAVHLRALLAITHPTAHAHVWALQLWACGDVPVTAAAVEGHLVAEIVLPPIGEVADDTEHFEACVDATPPAGSADHVMVLVLASGKLGHFSDRHDFVAYPRREQFPQPRLEGSVGFRLHDPRVTLEVERLVSPRPVENLSGTLALELWALAAPYRGGSFTGMPMAGVALDPVGGQSARSHLVFDLPCATPPPGTWHLTLMLREWTAGGYRTRDSTNFAMPLTVPAPATAQEPPPNPATPAPNAPESRSVSINEASPAELAAVKGLPVKVADAIVRRRPFSSLDELLKIKGMGVKLLARLRARLRL
jgi:hypothetical protein